MSKSIEEFAEEARKEIADADAAVARMNADCDAMVARVLTQLAGKPELHELVRALYGARGLVSEAAAGGMPKPSALAVLLAAILKSLGQ